MTRAIRDRDDVLVCRLVMGKVTLVHRRLWPALVRMAHRFPAERLAQIREVHTSTGGHVTEETPFPDWVPADVREAGRRLSERSAVIELGPWLE